MISISDTLHCNIGTHFLCETRLQLATLYVQMGQADDALMVLESDPNSEKEDDKAASSEVDLFSLQQDEAAEESVGKEPRTKVGKEGGRKEGGRGEGGGGERGREGRGEGGRGERGGEGGEKGGG